MTVPEPAAPTAPQATRRREAAVLALVALLVILPGLNWGIPRASGPDRLHAWGNDDQVPLAPLNEMYQTFVEAQPNRNAAYPWGQFFLVGVAYAPYLGVVAATGGFDQPTATYPFGLRNPERTFRLLSWIGRSVSVVLAVVAVLGAWYAARVLWGPLAGLTAGAFVLLLFPFAYYARVGNPDAAALGWTSLGLAAAARCLRDGFTPRRGILLGVFVALAGASKDQALASFFLLGPALTVLHWHRGRQAGERTLAALRAPAVALAAFLVASLLAHGVLVDPERWSQHLHVLTGGGSPTYQRHEATLAGYAAQTWDLIVHLTDVMSLPGLGIVLIGVGLAARRFPASLVLTVASAGFFVMLVPVRLSRIHYLLPVALPLTLFAGYAVSTGLRANGQWLRRGTAAVAAATGVFLALRVVDLTHDMIRDARFAAGDWLAERFQPGDEVLYFGASLKLPALPADVRSVQVSWRDSARSAVEDGPDFILMIPEDTNEDRRRVEWRRGPHSVRSDYLPDDLYDDLVHGAVGYRLVARFQTPRLMPWLPRPFLSYATVNPPVHVFARVDRLPDAEAVAPWAEAPYYPAVRRSEVLRVDRTTGGLP